MRIAAALILCLLANTGFAGTISSAGAGAAPTTNATNTYYIFGETQSLVQRETDTYLLGPGNSDVEQMAEWICTNKATYNIKGVLSVGDMLNDASIAAEWNVIDLYEAIFDTCALPFIPTFGNHDGDPTVASGGTPTDATNFHTRVGQTALNAKTWWTARGIHPDWTETSGAASLYDENTTTFRSRSFAYPFIPNRLTVASVEWEGGIRISKGNSATKSEGWMRGLVADNSRTYFIMLTHAGPCDSPENCDLTPESSSGGNSARWAAFLDVTGPNLAVSLNGHWNRGAQGCSSGAGTAATAVRDAGSRWLAAAADFTCGTREDPTALSTIPTSAYTWMSWLQLRRASRQFCYETVRVIDVDTDNDGTPNAGPATLLPSAQIGRGSLNHPDPASDPGCVTGVGKNDDGPNNCPNVDTLCMSIVALPELD